MHHIPHASSVILKACLPFVALVALSREARVAASASSSVRLSKVAAKVGSGARPSTASARSHQRVPEKVCSSIEAFPILNRSAKLPVGFARVSRGGLASSRSINLQVQLKRRSCQLASPALVCFAIQIQSKAAGARAWSNPSFKRTCLRHAA
jgi:hypothetical protein